MTHKIETVTLRQGTPLEWQCPALSGAPKPNAATRKTLKDEGYWLTKRPDGSWAWCAPRSKARVLAGDLESIRADLETLADRLAGGVATHQPAAEVPQVPAGYVSQADVAALVAAEVARVMALHVKPAAPDPDPEPPAPKGKPKAKGAKRAPRSACAKLARVVAVDAPASGIAIPGRAFKDALKALVPLQNAASTLHVLRHVEFDGQVLRSFCAGSGVAEVDLGRIGGRGELRALVPFADLLDVVRGVKAKDTVRIAIVDPSAPHVHVRVSVGAIHRDLPLYPLAELADLPAPGAVDWTDSAEVSSDEWSRMFGRVSAAIPARDPRRVLLGACFDLGATSLRVCGTDGRKLVLDRPACIATKGTGRVIVPDAVLRAIQRAQVLTEAPISIRWDAAGKGAHGKFGLSVFVRIGDVFTLRHDAIEGDFPRWEMVIPDRFDNGATFNARALADAAREVGKAKDKGEFGVELVFDGSACTVNAHGREAKASASVAATGSAGTLLFNFAFLADLLGAAEAESVTLRWNHVSTPCVLDDGTSNTLLLMPIKRSDYEPAPEDEASDSEA